MSRTADNPSAAVNSAVSIVSAYNDPAIRRECLDQSACAYRRHAPGVEYLPDNVNGRDRGARAAPNRGACLAGNDVVVFVRQDVLLHSLAAMIRAAGQLRVGVLGLRGAVGVHGDGRIAGRRRERSVLVGVPVQQSADVDSVEADLHGAPPRGAPPSADGADSEHG